MERVRKGSFLKPRIGADLVEYLSQMYKPRCIGPGEALTDAHRYAGKVELAQQLIRMATTEEDEVDISVQED